VYSGAHVGLLRTTMLAGLTDRSLPAARADSVEWRERAGSSLAA
jgi:hypothetical protein